MKFTKATNYALHTMLALFDASSVKPIGVQQLAEIQGVSPTYLSKILTRLVKAGMIESVSGANGDIVYLERKMILHSWILSMPLKVMPRCLNVILSTGMNARFKL